MYTYICKHVYIYTYRYVYMRIGIDIYSVLERGTYHVEVDLSYLIWVLLEALQHGPTSL